MRYYIYILVVVWSCISCSKEYTPTPQKGKELPVVLGEITPDKTINVVLSDAKNITLAAERKSGLFSDVLLLDNKGNSLDTFKLQEKNRWTSNFSAKAGNNYKLRFKYRNKTIEANTKIPSVFTAKITEKQLPAYDTLLLKIDIANMDKDSFFVVECWQYSKGYYSKLLFLNNNRFTDNIKYSELSAPYGRLFFKTSSSQQITLKIIGDNFPSNLKDIFTEIRVKKVSRSYYDYLYNYELQQQDEEFYLPYNSNYLGVWGGAYNVVFKI